MPHKSIKQTWIAIVCIVSSFAFAPAAPGHPEQQSACDIKSGASPDVVIRSCTAVIEAGDKMGKNIAAALTIRGRAHRARGDYDSAIADYTAAIDIEPSYALAFYSRGIAYFNKTEYERAIKDYTESLRLAPGDIIALQNRGHAYQAKQDYGRAIADFTAAIQIEPKFAGALNDRCYARAMSGRDLSEAIDDCNEAVRVVPNNFHTLDSRGFAYLRLGDYDKAIADYNAVLKINPRQAASLYGRGLARQKNGDDAAGHNDVEAAKAIRADIPEEFARAGVK